MREVDLLHEGNVARILKPIWYSQGRIAADAFALRPRIHEDYISVLRENHVDFLANVFTVCKTGIDCSYALLPVEQIEGLSVPELMPNRVNYQISLVDNKKLKSHAGIFVSVNGELLVGGEPLTSLVGQGKAQKTAVLLIQLKLAKLAEQNVKRLLLSSSLEGTIVSEPASCRKKKCL